MAERVRSTRSRRARRAFAVAWSLVGALLVFLAMRHFEQTEWPLSRGSPALIASAGLLFVV